MRQKIVFGALTALGLALGLGAGRRLTRPAGQPAAARPNIIFIIADDHTAQAISAYGSRLAQTLGIDRLAREGAILYNNVVSNSICGPSRATLLTGKLSHINGFRSNEEHFNRNQAVFPEELQKTATRPPGLASCTWAACPAASTT